MQLVYLIPIILFLLCYIMGDFLQILFKFKSGLALKIITGYLFLIGIFHILSLPFMYYELKFSTLYYIYIGMIVSIVIAYIVLSIIFSHFKLKREFINIIKSITKNRLNIFWWLVVIVLIVFQLQKVFNYVQINIDDQFYVSQITTMLDRNIIMDIMPSSGQGLFTFPDIYKMVSFETWEGVICKLANVPPAVLCHTIIPLFFIPLTYLVIYKVGKEFVGERVPIFLIFICLLNIFSGFSSYTQGAFLLLRIWQGKAVMVNIILPLVLFAFIKIMKEKKVSWKVLLFLYSLLLAAFHTSTVGVVFIPISYGVYTLVYLIYTRKIKDFLKLCIPAVLIFPLVIQKFVMMFSSTDVDAFSEGIEKFIYCKEIFKFLGESHILLLLIVAYVVIIIKSKRITSYMLVLYSVILFVLFLNPFVAQIVATKLTGVAVYWRLFWLLQSGIVIATAMTFIVFQVKKFLPQILLVICMSWLVAYTGSTIFTEKYFPKGIVEAEDEESVPDNEVFVFEDPRDIEYTLDYDQMYKLSLFSIKVSDIIKEIQEKENLDQVNLLLTEKKSLEIRQYTDINLVWFNYVIEYYHSYGYFVDEQRLYDLYTAIYLDKKWDIDYLMNELEHFKVNFIVMKVSAAGKNTIPDEFQKLYEDETYILYRIRY